METNKSVKLGEKLQRCISLFPIHFLNSFIYVFYCGYIIKNIKNISIRNSEKIGAFFSFNFLTITLLCSHLNGCGGGLTVKFI